MFNPLRGCGEKVLLYSPDFHPGLFKVEAFQASRLALPCNLIFSLMAYICRIWETQMLFYSILEDVVHKKKSPS